MADVTLLHLLCIEQLAKPQRKPYRYKIEGVRAIQGPKLRQCKLHVDRMKHSPSHWHNDAQLNHSFQKL